MKSKTKLGYTTPESSSPPNNFSSEKAGNADSDIPIVLPIQSILNLCIRMKRSTFRGIKTQILQVKLWQIKTGLFSHSLTRRLLLCHILSKVDFAAWHLKSILFRTIVLFTSGKRLPQAYCVRITLTDHNLHLVY